MEEERPLREVPWCQRLLLVPYVIRFIVIPFVVPQLLTLASLFPLQALLVILGFWLWTLFEVFRRRNHRSNDAQPFFLTLVPCPSIFDPAQKYISLIIPAFNEENRLPETLHEIMSYLQQRMEKDKSFTYEVLIVDDGSVDGTNKVAFNFVRKYSMDCIRVIRLERNHGKGEAVRRGMLQARGEYLLMLDADGGTDINEIEKLEFQIHATAERELRLGNAVLSDSSSRNSDIPIAVFGSRGYLANTFLHARKWYQNLLMQGFFLIVPWVFHLDVCDTQCGFKMFSRGAARKLFTNIRLKRWCFDVELAYLCKHLGIPIVEIDVSWLDIPGSKLSRRSILHSLGELVLMSVGYKCSIWKIYNPAEIV